MSEAAPLPVPRRRLLSWLGAMAGVTAKAMAGVTAAGRARGGLAAGAVVLAQLAGCAASAVPPTVWLRLATDLPAAASAAAGGPATQAATGGSTASGAPSAAAGAVWQLMLPLPLPAHLDRDSLFVPQGTSGALVRPLAGARWVEPLRDAVPRLLREDLSRRMGGRPLWAAPLPPGLVPTHQLRVEITAFEIGADGRTLATQARWSIADARGTRPPVVHEARFGMAASQPEAADSWALAHRQAIAALAERIAATMTAP